MKSIHDLKVYRLAESLSDFFWEAYDHWPSKVQNTIGLQIIRSSDSISANLSEGFGRYHHLDRVRFYYIARGSFEETKTWARKLVRRKVLHPDEIELVTKMIHELGPNLNAFIRGVKKQSNDPKKSNNQ